MFRRYRLFFVAVAGLALVAAQQTPENTQDQPSGEKSQVAATPITAASELSEPAYRPFPNYDPDPCYDDENHDSADLCAQWKAARAAEKAALWGVIATILSFITVAGLIITIWQTHGALDAARRGNILAMKENARTTRRSVAQADETATALRAARKSANAMAKVALTLKGQAKFVEETTATNKQVAEMQKRYAILQLRAYLSVTVGHALFQHRESNIRFEARPVITNTGQTAAKEVAYRIRSAILPYPLPEKYAFPELSVAGERGFIPPQQNRFMSAVVENFIDESRVSDAMFRKGWALYVWGDVSYKDEFENKRETTFGFCHYWTAGEGDNLIVQAEYLAGMNDAT